MSETWNPGPVEPWPDRSAEAAAFVAAMRQIQEAAQRGAAAMATFRDWVILFGLGLEDWNDEMDNCYPNWPE